MKMQLEEAFCDPLDAFGITVVLGKGEPAKDRLPTIFWVSREDIPPGT